MLLKGFFKRLILKPDGDLFGAGLVALVDEQLNEPGLIEVAGDYDLLPLLYVYADAGDKTRVPAKHCLFHVCFSFRFRVFVNDKPNPLKIQQQIRLFSVFAPQKSAGRRSYRPFGGSSVSLFVS